MLVYRVYIILPRFRTAKNNDNNNCSEITLMPWPLQNQTTARFTIYLLWFTPKLHWDPYNWEIGRQHLSHLLCYIVKLANNFTSSINILTWDYSRLPIPHFYENSPPTWKGGRGGGGAWCRVLFISYFLMWGWTF